MVAFPDAQPHDEQSLVRRLRDGEESAFEELVRREGARMHAVARRFFSNEADAGDAVQDAFLAAFRALDGFSESARLSTWLHRIVVNACLMKIRSRKARPESSIEDLLPKFIGDGHHAVEPADWTDVDVSAAERSEMRVIVRTAIDSLPETHRTILILRDIEGYSTAEAASALAISETAIKVRLHRARQALRTLLDRRFHHQDPLTLSTAP